MTEFICDDEKSARNDLKIKFVYDFVSDEETILDIGCGSGYYLRSLLNRGYNAFGIEANSGICDNFLLELPHKCVDVVKFSNLKSTTKYDSAVCIDVLEHIKEKELNDVLKSIVKLGEKCLFGIANHEDIQNGVALHEIIKHYDWWIEKLSQYYANVELVAVMFGDKFFFIKCSNKVEKKDGKLELTNTEEDSSLLGKEQTFILHEVSDGDFIFKTES